MGMDARECDSNTKVKKLVEKIKKFYIENSFSHIIKGILFFHFISYTMLYFAYGSNMFTYRLERRIGKVEKIGIARLSKHKFAVHKKSVDGSVKADAFITDSGSDYILGVLYKINPDTKPELDTAEGFGKGYEQKKVSVELIDHPGKPHELIEAFTYFATDFENGNVPYNWYMELIIAGATEHKLPDDYIAFLKSIPTKEDTNESRKSVNLSILNESTYIRKNLSESIELMQELITSKECILAIPDHALDTRKIIIEKSVSGFSFQTDSKIQKGVQTHKELNVRDKVLGLIGRSQNFFVEGKHFLINNIQFDDENLLKHLKGTINALSSIEQKDLDDKYLRLIIPIKHGLKIDRDYRCIPFVLEYKVKRGILEININQKIFHFYDAKWGDNNYLVIDCLSPSKIRDFQIACNSILLTYAFLSGEYNTGEGYFYAFSNVGFENPLGIFYYSMSEPIDELYGVFTTNPYLGQDFEKLERDEKGNIKEEISKELWKDLDWLPSQIFGNICDFAFRNDKVLRTLIILISKNPSLELKIPLQFVALETITAALVTGGNKELKPIENDKLSADLVGRLTAVVNEFSKEHSLETPAEQKLLPIRRKIETLNAPPNADKLIKSFALLGYPLSDEEKRIIGKRNTFLHGSTISLGFEEDDFKELFYISLRLHFLIAVLILKKAGYTGKIINYVKLFEYITEKYFEEDILKKI